MNDIDDNIIKNVKHKNLSIVFALECKLKEKHSAEDNVEQYARSASFEYYGSGMSDCLNYYKPISKIGL